MKTSNVGFAVRSVLAIALAVGLASMALAAQQAPEGGRGGRGRTGGGGTPTLTPPAARNSPTMPALPMTIATSVQRIRVSAVALGLVNPWSLVFLPDGDMLVTERPGRLRIVRKGVLDPTPVAGVPAVKAAALAGLLEVALHPRFAENQLLYLSYSKAGENNLSTTALARARFDGTTLSDVKDIFVANTWSKSNTNFGGRIAFDRQGSCS